MKYKYHLYAISIVVFLLLSSFVSAQLVSAQSTIDLNNGQGFGLAKDGFKINNIRVDTPIGEGDKAQIITTFYNVIFKFDPAAMILLPVSIEPACATLQVQVTNSADNNKPLTFANVTVEHQTQQTDGNGIVKFEHLSAIHLAAHAVKEGFDPLTRELDLKCDTDNKLVLALHPISMPIVAEIPHEVRIVLNWGDNPRELDAHLTGPEPGASANYNNEPERFHVYFANVNNAIAKLDVDKLTATKPQTVTIPTPMDANKLRPGVYRFTVHHFAGNGNLADSDAQVRLKVGNQSEQVFTPPSEGKDQLKGEGTDIWTVFELAVNDKGEVTVNPIQKYGTVTSPGLIR